MLRLPFPHPCSPAQHDAAQEPLPTENCRLRTALCPMPYALCYQITVITPFIAGCTLQ